ncbi:MAG: hypothetical protein J6A54_03250 [Clostridia bacterium]|nr:hypothetical protein [Clostridia bacterium]
MKVVILPNDTKLADEGIKDAMIKVGGIPVFFHVIMMFEKRGFTDFIICDTSSTHDIRDYLNANRDMITGINVRLLKLPSYLKNGKILSICEKYGLENAFFVAPNDVITDLDPEKMLYAHRQSGMASTVFVAEERFYLCALDSEREGKYESKMINTGIYLFEPEAIDYMLGNSQIENEALIRLAEDGELNVYSADNFMQRANSGATDGEKK